MSYSLIAYVLFCIIFGLTVISMFMKTGRMVSALIGLILIALIFVFYGLRWFTNKSSVVSSSWPPVINTCPDYLVYYKSAVFGDTCVDLLGVNRSSGSLMSWTKDMTPSKPPSGANYYFRNTYNPSMTAPQVNSLCTATIQAGLTWEGITNGEACTYTGK